MKDFELRPPGGVSIQMWKDNSIHFRLGKEQVQFFQLALQELQKQLNQFAIETLEAEKNNELRRVVLPPSRIQQLEAELKRLREEDNQPAVFVSEGFEPNDGSLPLPGE